MPYSRAKQKRVLKQAMWPDLRYGPKGECKLFHAPEDVPEGWVARPDQQYDAPAPKPLNRDELIEKLKAKGVEINPIWGVAHLKKVLDS